MLPAPETFWASLAYPYQISQIQEHDCFLPPPITHMHTPGTTTQRHGYASSHSIDSSLVLALGLQASLSPGYAMPAFNLAKQASLRAASPHKPPPEGAQWGHGVGGVLQDPLQTVGCTLRTLRYFANPESTLQTRVLHHCLLDQLFGIPQRRHSPVYF